MAQDTMIQLKSPSGWKLKAFIGIGAITGLVIIALAFLLPLQVGIAVMAIAGAISVGVILYGVNRYRVSRYVGEFEYRKMLAEVHKAEAEADKAKYEAGKAQLAMYFYDGSAGVFNMLELYTTQIEPKFYPSVSASKLLADVPMMLPAPETPKYRKLLDVDFVHMLITGATNTGKTTVASWLIDSASPDTICHVIDAHAKFSRWPNRVSKVIGKGRDYPAIDGMLISLMAEMDKRYNGNATIFQPILIIVDEWLSVLENCKNADRFFFTIGSEARKVAMHLVITSISATVDDMKVSASVRDNLVQLTLSRSLKEQNLGELKWSRGNTELVELPGQYVERYALPASVPAIEEMPILDDGPAPFTPTSDELKVYELHLQGKTLNAIWKEVYPDKSYGGIQRDVLKAILAKFGVSL